MLATPMLGLAGSVSKTGRVNTIACIGTVQGERPNSSCMADDSAYGCAKHHPRYSRGISRSSAGEPPFAEHVFSPAAIPLDAAFLANSNWRPELSGRPL
jgi:hypothetical protein